nr:S-layer homology domain-containing protein [uncultured Dysosmobacter sp.]
MSLPAKTPGGAVKVSPRYAEQGETVTVTVTPDPGYELDHLTVSQRDGRELDLTDKGNGKFTFTMPDAHVRLSAAFRAICQGSPFVDVAESAYYADAVKWAVENGVTGGTTAETFSPNASCTRAQMVTFLWRASGSPVVNHAMSFTDVPADAYYAEAVRWAVAQGITSGTTADTFSPNDTVTRAQAVTFIYRNVQAQGGGFTGSWMFPCPFTDVPADAYYFESVQWCAMKNITSGTTATAFSPSAPCTRAQIVTFLYRGLTA